MNFLDDILRQKREEIERHKRLVSLGELRDRAERLPTRDFKKAVSGGGRIIAEIKKRSPRVHAFRQTAFADKLAPVYEQNGASAISVVTDEANFGTSLRDATRARESVSLPVLVKDFYSDPYQVYEARAAGADAVLLISRILTVENLRSLLSLVQSLGMHGLVEVHSEDDLDKAHAAGAVIIGINNRDLDTMTVSIETTRRLLRRIREGVFVVSESGIAERRDIVELSQSGVDAFLIGGALLDAEDPGARLRSLLGIDETGAAPRDTMGS